MAAWQGQISLPTSRFILYADQKLQGLAAMVERVVKKIRPLGAIVSMWGDRRYISVG